jgi:hypothetical protein
LLALACTSSASDTDLVGTDDTEPPDDPYAGIVPSDAVTPLGLVEGNRVVHIMDVSTDGTTAWLASYRGGLTIDLSDPARPAGIGSPQGRQLYGADHDDDVVVFSGRESGVVLLDRGDDEILARLGRRIDEDEAPERAILVGDHVAIAAQTGGLLVVRQPDLTEVSRLGDATPNAFAVAAQGNRVAVGDRERGLVLVDLSVPASPTVLGSLELPSAAQDLVFAGDAVWVAAGSFVYGVDVSDPAAPRLVATLPTNGVATRLDASGALLAVAAWSDTRLYDISDPADPVLIATEDATQSATSVALHDDLLLVGDWDDLRLYRVDPTARSAELRADGSVLVVGEGVVNAGLVVANEGNLPLELGAVVCADARVTPTLPQTRLLPGETTAVGLAVDTGTGSAFEATCFLASNDIDEPSHPFDLRVNPVGLSVGDLAPTFTLADLDGTLHSLTDTQGKVVVISVFSSL